MIKIDLQRIYLNDLKEDSLFCLSYLDMQGLIHGCGTKIYKTFKTFSALKEFCEDNSSNLELSVICMTQEEIEELNKKEYVYINED